MAKITSHTLNGFDGTHAGDIEVSLTNLQSGKLLFSARMDSGGRLSQMVQASDIDPSATYELVFSTGPYWAARGIKANVGQIALRFEMKDKEGHYHMPIIINPNAYSMWASS